jgi:hypothetical protein
MIQAIAEKKHEMYMGVWMGCWLQGRLEKVRHVRSKVMSMLIIFFDIKGTVNKEFVLAGQKINTAYY